MICDIPENVPECSYYDGRFQNVEDHIVTDPIKFCTGPGIYLDPSDRTRYFDCVDIFQEKQYYLTIKKCPKNTTFHYFKKVCTNDESSNSPNQRYVPISSSWDGQGIQPIL